MSRTIGRAILCLSSICVMALGVAFDGNAAGNPPQQAVANGGENANPPINAGQKIEEEGLVVSRQGDTITMRTAGSSSTFEVILTDYTKVQTRHLLLGKKEMPTKDLLPGLWIKVQGVGSNSGVLAQTISFSGKDLRTAHAISAGIVPLETRVKTNEEHLAATAQDVQANREQMQANQQQVDLRFSKLDSYDVKFKTAVYFPIGNAGLSPQARSDLMQLARRAQVLDGYVLEVKGFTDATGDAALNQDLSMRRAQSVIAYLEQAGNIPLTHVLTFGAMGETDPAASNNTPQGRAENRRVEVQVLVNRGLVGQ